MLKDIHQRKVPNCSLLLKRILRLKVPKNISRKLQNQKHFATSNRHLKALFNLQGPLPNRALKRTNLLIRWPLLLIRRIDHLPHSCKLYNSSTPVQIRSRSPRRWPTKLSWLPSRVSHRVWSHKIMSVILEKKLPNLQCRRSQVPEVNWRKRPFFHQKMLSWERIRSQDIQRLHNLMLVRAQKVTLKQDHWGILVMKTTGIQLSLPNLRKRPPLKNRLVK